MRMRCKICGIETSSAFHKDGYDLVIFTCLSHKYIPETKTKWKKITMKDGTFFYMKKTEQQRRRA